MTVEFTVKPEYVDGRLHLVEAPRIVNVVVSDED